MVENILTQLNPNYHSKKSIVTLRKSKEAQKNIFLVHSGSGRINGYFLLSELIKDDFNVYGITLDKEITFAPKKLSIQHIAENYLEHIKKKQDKGPYYIGGWCIGGIIAFELASQLEAQGEEVAFCGLFNTNPPKTFSQLHPKDFSVESENSFILEYIKDDLLREKLKTCKSVDEFWEVAGQEMQWDLIDKKKFIEADEFGWTNKYPDINSVALYDIVYGLNIIRTLHDARVFYIPSRKLKAPIYFFSAEALQIDSIEAWEKYCERLIISLTPGGHDSMLENENVKQLAKKLNQVMY